MVDSFRVGQSCVLASPAFERVARPSLVDGRRAPALRFGDPRVMALAGALCAIVHTITGFTNRSLRAQVATLLGVPYSMGQMSYDLHAPRGALLYPQRSWEELEGRFLGPMAYLDAKARGNSSLPEKQWLWSGV